MTWVTTHLQTAPIKSHIQGEWGRGVRGVGVVAGVSNKRTPGVGTLMVPPNHVTQVKWLGWGKESY